MLNKRFTTTASLELGTFLDGLVEALRIRKTPLDLPVVQNYFKDIQTAREQAEEGTPMPPNLTGFNLNAAAYRQMKANRESEAETPPVAK